MAALTRSFRKSGKYDVLDIKSTQREFAITLGEFVPDDPDVETRIAEILRKHDAFDDDLLKELVELVEAERDDAWESGADDSRYSAERE
jgi:hypothetical protein